MPYFLFEIHTRPIRHTRLLSEHTSFREASQNAKALRAATDLPVGCTIKLMHGDNALAAEYALQQERVNTHNGGDDL